MGKCWIGSGNFNNEVIMARISKIKMPFSVSITETGKNAMEYARENNIPVVITGKPMPAMGVFDKYNAKLLEGLQDDKPPEGYTITDPRDIEFDLPFLTLRNQ